MDQVRKLLIITDESQRAPRDSCRSTLITIFSNILNNPGELKYRKIREENEVIKKNVFAFENSRDILEIAGFDRTGAKAATGPSWVFMAAPEDDEAMNALTGVLLAIQKFNPEKEDEVKVQVLNDDDANSSSNKNNNNNEVVPPELLAAARQAFGQQQQQNSSNNNTNLNHPDAAVSSSSIQQQQQEEREHMTLAPKFFSFARSMGFQMRMEALKQKQQQEENEKQDAAADSSSLSSFIVELLLDPRNSDVLSETLRIIRVLVDNMRKDPAEIKYRLLKYDNPILGKNFFPIHGAPELFIGILGFSLSDEGLAKEKQSDEVEEKQVQQVAGILERVEEGLKARRQIENEERRRLAAEEMKSEIDAERKRQGIRHNNNNKNRNGNDDDQDDGEKKKPRRMIPISQAINYLLGKPLEEDE